MEFNLFKNLRGQAKGMARVIKNLSPKIQDVKGYTTKDALTLQVDKSLVHKKYNKYSKIDTDLILQKKLTAILKDRDSKEARYSQQDKLAKESIYMTLLEQFMEDAFGIDPDDKVVSVDILNDDAEIRNLLEIFPNDYIDRTNIEEILTDNLQNTFLKYGELFLRKVYNNKKLVVSFEIMDGRYVYPICNGTGVCFYIVLDPINNDFDVYDEDEILAFQLNPEIKTIVSGDSKLESMLKDCSDDIKALIPDGYKIGTPLLYNARNELTQLRIANLLNDMAQLRAMAMPQLLAVNVENIRDEEQLSELLDTYNDFLEDIIEIPNIDTSNSEETDIESLVNLSIKCIPVEGSGKNGLSNIEFNSNTNATDDQSYVDRKLLAVARASGIPINTQGENSSKQDLSTQRRYRNRCKAAQRFIVRPLHKEFMRDFEIQNIDVSPEQIRVFCKAIVSLDTAEDLEISLGAITQASQVYEALLTISDNSEEYTIDEEGYYDYFNTLLSPFKGAQKLLKKREELEEDTDNLGGKDDDNNVDFNNTFDINMDNDTGLESESDIVNTDFDTNEDFSKITEETTETTIPETITPETVIPEVEE